MASDTKLPFVSVKLTANSLGDRPGSSSQVNDRRPDLVGDLVPIRRALGLPSSRASIRSSWYRLYQP